MFAGNVDGRNVFTQTVWLFNSVTVVISKGWIGTFMSPNWNSSVVEFSHGTIHRPLELSKVAPGILL